jgi:hypothetical protein
MNYKFEKSSENLKTSILSILQMTPKNREKFYASENGRDIIKGLFLEAENYKKAYSDGMNWTPEELEETIIKLRESSEDDFKIFLQLLPGPVQTRISEYVNKARSNNGLSPTVIEKGARVGTAGYEKWLAKRRQHMQVAHSSSDTPIKTGSKAPKAPKPPKPVVPKGPKSPKLVGYGKFISKKPKGEKKSY